MSNTLNLGRNQQIATQVVTLVAQQPLLGDQLCVLNAVLTCIFYDIASSHGCCDTCHCRTAEEKITCPKSNGFVGTLINEFLDALKSNLIQSLQVARLNDAVDATSLPN